MVIKEICLSLLLILAVEQLCAAKKSSKMKKVLERFNELQAKMTDDQENLAGMKEMLGGVEDKLDTLAEVSGKQNQLAEVKNKLQQIAAESGKLDGINSKLDHLAKVPDKLQQIAVESGKLDGVNSKLDNLANVPEKLDHLDSVPEKLDQLSEVNDKILKEVGSHVKKYNSSFIGFTAWKNSTQVYTKGDVITFEGILINQGDHYSTLTSRFTCPLNGVYFLAVALRQNGGVQIMVDIVKDSGLVVRYYTGGTPNITSSNSAVIYCSSGEQIWVQAWHNGQVYGETRKPVTTFTIMLMNEGGTAAAHSNFIGASVWKNTKQTTTKGHIITFEKIFFNEDNDYKTASNRFLCPSSGIYYISLHAHKYLGHNMHMGVDLATYTVLQLEDDVSEHPWDTVSNSLLIHCDAHDYISVKGTSDGSVYGGIGNGDPRTTFSVMLISDQEIYQHQALVAFSAWKKSGQLYELGNTISYKGVVVNEGNHYDPIRSRFVCPFNAVYFVAVTCKKWDGELQVEVQKQTVTILRLIDSSNRGVMVTNTALTRCLPGEVIQVVGAGSGQVYGDASKKLTTFTAFMMSY